MRAAYERIQKCVGKVNMSAGWCVSACSGTGLMVSFCQSSLLHFWTYVRGTSEQCR